MRASRVFSTGSQKARWLPEAACSKTLDPTTRRLRVPVEKEVLLADTVGFIRDLPPELIEVFRATLEEIETSVLILHVVDASSPESRERMDAVAKILSELELGDIPQLVIFNKSDLLSPEEPAGLGRMPDSIVVSARTGDGMDALIDRVGALVKTPETRQLSQLFVETAVAVVALASNPPVLHRAFYHAMRLGYVTT